MLIVTVPYSNFVEIEWVHRANTQGVTKLLKPIHVFAYYETPDVGPQFDLDEFKKQLARAWGF